MICLYGYKFILIRAPMKNLVWFVLCGYKFTVIRAPMKNCHLADSFQRPMAWNQL